MKKKLNLVIRDAFDNSEKFKLTADSLLSQRCADKWLDEDTDVFVPHLVVVTEKRRFEIEPEVYYGVEDIIKACKARGISAEIVKAISTDDNLAMLVNSGDTFDENFFDYISFYYEENEGILFVKTIFPEREIAYTELPEFPVTYKGVIMPIKLWGNFDSPKEYIQTAVTKEKYGFLNSISYLAEPEAEPEAVTVENLSETGGKLSLVLSRHGKYAESEIVVVRDTDILEPEIDENDMLHFEFECGSAVATFFADGEILTDVEFDFGVIQKNYKFLSADVAGVYRFTKIAPRANYLVSCIVPIYKVEKYLEEAIESVIAQTIGFEKNVQLILVNDGSPDGCGEICERYADMYTQNVVYIEQENKGVSAARNAGLDVACGKYLAFLDGDDKYEFYYMDDCVRAQESKNQKYDVIDNKKFFATNKVNMPTYKYKVSVIVPCYNVENWLRVCIDSLLAQTIKTGEMEIVLVNDGSSDHSWDICLEYARKHSFVKAYAKGNGGLSSARNFGVRRANGKYLMYIDSDDTYSPNTVKAVIDFFEKHFDEVDLVTFKDQAYANGQKQKEHYRYKFLKNTGIYDLLDSKCRFIKQTRVNVAVKNKGVENILFDTRFSVNQEDQFYCNALVCDKMKIGYVAEGEYKYNKDNSESIATVSFNPINLFEPVIQEFEELFALFLIEVPQYFQAHFIHDLAWKLQSNILFPYHYSPEAFDNAMDRIKKMLNRVDIDVIMSCPEIDNFHRHFWLSLKENKIIEIETDASVRMIVDGREIYKRDNFEIIVTKLEIRNGIIDFIGFVKSPIFNYTEETLVVYVEENENNNLRSLDLVISAESMYHCRTITNKFWTFRYKLPVVDIHSFRMYVRFGSNHFIYPTVFWFSPTTGFNSATKRFSIVRENYRISFTAGNFRFEELASPYEARMNLALSEKNLGIREIKARATQIRNMSRIWLYFDMAHVGKDNGYYQFENDISKDDGISRFYVTASKDICVPVENQAFVVDWGSQRHYELLLAAEKIFTAFLGEQSYMPFSRRERSKYSDFLDAEIIYLQHGVLHASYTQCYSLDWNNCDRIVVSSYFEQKNFTGKYHWAEGDLIPVGMARYDKIDKTVEVKNRILLAPSWRSYFAQQSTESGWQVSSGKFFKSNYYKGITEFMNDTKLHEMLEEHDMYLDVKLHPIAAGAEEIFGDFSDRIQLVSSVEVEDYKVFITDFSSWVFDFVHLERAIMYFVPDWDEFRCGINAYRELDLPFEDAFGELSKNSQDALKSLEKILDNDCVPEKAYVERMREFFIPGYNHCERLYQVMMAEGRI
ncbi:hypothetical protein FACS1894202_06560 [Clostridia bacterium]|nr:hypothetical protein FACS1894202_06560 [Clostridia bacterium]